MNDCWEVTIRAPAEADEAIAYQIAASFPGGPAVYRPADSPRVALTVYCPLTADRRLLRQQFKQIMTQIEASGLCVRPWSFRCRKLVARAWAHAWKRHFAPLEIGAALLIKPSWSRRRARPTQRTIVLDPGLSFGTGQHPTTRFCLEQLVAARIQRGPQSFLDAGTGSGILAIAAAKLGYRPVWAFDLDPVSVRVARRNASRNRVRLGPGRFRVFRANLAAIKKRQPGFDVICANLTADVLQSGATQLVGQLAADGRLILAGILAREFLSVQRTFAKLKFRLVTAATEGAWRSGTFMRAQVARRSVVAGRAR